LIGVTTFSTTGGDDASKSRISTVVTCSGGDRPERASRTDLDRNFSCRDVSSQGVVAFFDEQAGTTTTTFVVTTRSTTTHNQEVNGGDAGGNCPIH
jgi:hypothetical protein